MEVAAFAGLAGIGYALSRLTGKKEGAEGFATQGPTFQNFLKADSGTVARKSVPGTEWDTTVQGGTYQSRGGSGAELDMMYQTPGGNSYRSEPSPGPYGMPVSFATQVPTTGAFMSPLEDATAQMNYKSDGTGSADIFGR